MPIYLLTSHRFFPKYEITKARKEKEKKKCDFHADFAFADFRLFRYVDVVVGAVAVADCML